MYGLDRTQNLEFLRTRELLQISVGLFQLILVLDDHVSISIECEAECQRDG